MGRKKAILRLRGGEEHGERRENEEGSREKGTGWKEGEENGVRKRRGRVMGRGNRDEVGEVGTMEGKVLTLHPLEGANPASA